MKRVETVWVINKSDEPFSDRYDGEDFTIAPGDMLEMEASCAQLVFGYGEPDKTRAIRRLGWAPSLADMKDAKERLFKFSFHMEQPTEDELSSLLAPGTAADAAEDAVDAESAAPVHRGERKQRGRAARGHAAG